MKTRKFVAALFVAFFMSGCAQMVTVTDVMAPQVELPMTTLSPNPQRIRLTIREDASELCAKLMGVKKSAYQHIIACTLFRRGSDLCEIIVKPNVSHAALGHEMHHCFYYHFHD